MGVTSRMAVVLRCLHAGDDGPLQMLLADRAAAADLVGVLLDMVVDGARARGSTLDDALRAHAAVKAERPLLIKCSHCGRLCSSPDHVCRPPESRHGG